MITMVARVCPECGATLSMVANHGRPSDWACTKCGWRSWTSTKPAFEREDRYLILKRKDMDAAGLTKLERCALHEICMKVQQARHKRGAGILDAVVVEHDWPEYEQVWKLIENRMRHENRNQT